jgi:N,N'-diacetylchitobiose transport system substrate-binding protein
VTRNPLRHRGRLLGAALAVAALTATTACSSSSAGEESGPVTLNVWLMKDSAPDALVKQVNDEFAAAHKNVKVKPQILDWDGRDAKWKTALASDTPPDVLEMGNTDVLAYSSSGGLADLTKREFENQSTWLQGLKEAGSYENKLYGVPYYGGDRVVIYRKDLWAKAKLTAAPTDLAGLKDAAVKLAAAGGKDFSGLYFPGRYQYAALPFVYDTGGAIATKDGDKWKASLSSPESQKGLANWADFVKAASKAPADADETNLPDVMGQNKTAMIIGQAWMVGLIGKNYPALADKLDAFPVPGTSGPMPVFLGGSNLAASAAGKHQDLAYEWIKLMTGTKYQTALGKAGLLPNTTSLDSAVTGITAVQLKAASKSWFTPTSTKWSNVDNAKVIQDMFQAIAKGDKTVEAAAKDADAKIDQILGGS